jgi:hypothetical protein
LFNDFKHLIKKEFGWKVLISTLSPNYLKSHTKVPQKYFRSAVTMRQHSAICPQIHFSS